MSLWRPRRCGQLTSPQNRVENSFVNISVHSGVVKDGVFLDLELGNLKMHFSLFTLPLGLFLFCFNLYNLVNNLCCRKQYFDSDTWP